MEEEEELVIKTLFFGCVLEHTHTLVLRPPGAPRGRELLEEPHGAVSSWRSPTGP